MDRSRSIRCRHPNVFGCPNHGRMARALIRARLADLDQRPRRAAPLAPGVCWPTPFVLTAKGHAAATLSSLLDGPLEV